MLKVFSSNNCKGCRSLKRYLNNEGVEYKEYNIDENKLARKYLLLKGMWSTPVVEFPNGEMMLGWGEKTKKRIEEEIKNEIYSIKNKFVGR